MRLKSIYHKISAVRFTVDIFDRDENYLESIRVDYTAPRETEESDNILRVVELMDRKADVLFIDYWKADERMHISVTV